MPTTNQGAHYEIIDGQFVSAGKAASLIKANSQPVAGLPDPQREQPAIQTLARCPQSKARGTKRPVISIAIVSFREREVDSDNIIAGAKGLRDAIAARLCIDDGDKRIRWHYAIIFSPGIRGTQIVIQSR